jgi:hypothetical protein
MARSVVDSVIHFSVMPEDSAGATAECRKGSEPAVVYPATPGPVFRYSRPARDRLVLRAEHSESWLPTSVTLRSVPDEEITLFDPDWFWTGKFPEGWTRKIIRVLRGG